MTANEAQMDYSAMMAAAIRQASGLAPDQTLIQPSNTDYITKMPADLLGDRQNDPLLLGMLLSSTTSPEEKTDLIVQFTDTLFHPEAGKALDGPRVGAFLKTAAALYGDPKCEKSLKWTIKDAITPADFERVMIESATAKWDVDAVAGAIEGYATIQTMEDVLGEEEVARRVPLIARRILAAQHLDDFMSLGAKRLTSQFVLMDDDNNVVAQTEANLQNPQYQKVFQGNSIWLGNRGSETAEVIFQDAYLEACRTLDTKPVIATYYRNSTLATNLGDQNEDPQGYLQRPDQTMAQQFRVQTDGIRGARELAVACHIANDGKHISLLPAYPQVGLNYSTGLGSAFKEKFDAERGGKNATNAVVIVGGDGTMPQAARSFQMMADKPAVNLVLSNDYMIGVKTKSVWNGKNFSDAGNGFGVPGIRVRRGQNDKLWLSAYFAAQRAMRGGTATIIQADVSRLKGHSDSHGNTEAAYISDDLIKYIAQVVQSEPRLEDAARPLIQKLLHLGSGLDLLKLREELRTLRESKGSEVLDAIKPLIERKINEIVDPAELFFKEMQERNYLSRENLQLFDNQEASRMEEVYQDVIERDLPNPQDALPKLPLFNVIKPNPELEGRRFTMTNAGAIMSALQEEMKIDPNILVVGVDAFKGKAVHTTVADGKTHREMIYEGGYWGETRGLKKIFPNRVISTQIDEGFVMGLALGAAFTATSEMAMRERKKIIVIGGYGDYDDDNDPIKRNAGGPVRYATNEMITSGVLDLAGVGILPGAGTSHLRSNSGLLYTQSHDMPLFFTSSPQETYLMMKYLLRHGLLSPSTLRWDKRTWNDAEEFDYDPNIVPGRARIAKPGNDIQILTFGPMVNRALQAVRQMEGMANTGIMSLFSLRPFPFDDVENFLREGWGPIVVAEEDIKGQGFGDILIEMLFLDPRFAPHAKRRGVHLLASKEVAAIPCDGVLQRVILPNLKYELARLTA